MRLMRHISLGIMALVAGVQYGEGIMDKLMLTFVTILYLFAAFAVCEGILRVMNKMGKVEFGQIKEKAQLMLFPFAALAMVATFILGWELTHIFISAGIMTSMSLMGADLLHVTKKKLNIIVGTVFGFLVFMGLTQISLIVGGAL